MFGDNKPHFNVHQSPLMIDCVYLTGSNQCLYTKKGEEGKENQLSPIHCTFQAGPLFAFVSYLAICHLLFLPIFANKSQDVTTKVSGVGSHS